MIHRLIAGSILFCSLIVGSLVLPTLFAQVAATVEKSKSPGEKLGISMTKPKSGPAVELPNGSYMVSYTTKIPGTEVEFTMIPIPGGTFTMGSPEDEEDRRDDEGPQFKVNVEPFWMGKYEVSWAEYHRYMELYKQFQSLQADGLRTVTADNKVDAVTAPSPLYKPTFTYLAGDGDDEPSATMTQFAAKQYTKWLSRISNDFYRLPTEAEWEYACRGGTSTAYYFGDDYDDLEDHGWYFENSEEERQVSGQLKPNPFGLYDMCGNVAEWVLDGYDENGYTHVEAGATVSVSEAYRKPTKLYPRVVRGGSFELEPEDCRSAARVASDDKEWKVEDPNFPRSPWWYTDMPGTGVGFRLLRPLKAPDSIKERNEFWDADLEEILEDALFRIREKGKGAYGTADPKLPTEIESLNE